MLKTENTVRQTISKPETFISYHKIGDATKVEKVCGKKETGASQLDDDYKPR